MAEPTISGPLADAMRLEAAMKRGEEIGDGNGFVESRLAWSRVCVRFAPEVFLSSAYPRRKLFTAISAMQDVTTNGSDVQALTLLSCDPRFEDERDACLAAIRWIRCHAVVLRDGPRLPPMPCRVREPAHDLDLRFAHPTLAQAWIGEWECNHRKTFVGTITLAPTPLRDDDL